MPNAAHLHLIFVHAAPTMLWIGLLLLIFSSFYKNQTGLHLATLVVILMAAAGLVLAANTGESAADLVSQIPGISDKAIHDHEELGETMFPFALASAFLTIIWFTLLRKHPDKVRSWAWWASVLLVAGTAVFATVVSNVGGHIRHPEALESLSTASETQRPAVEYEVETEDSDH
ncbi:hypothetical protein KQI52_07075 [bacterium]|nr:hypothetical protein [bacterium]